MIARFRLLSCVACLLLCAGVVTACGSSSGGKGSVAGKSAADVLRETFGPGHEIHSGKVDLTLGVDSQGSSAISGPVSLQLSGPFQGQGGQKVPLFAFTASVSGAGQQLKAGATSTGTKGYVTITDRSYDVGPAFYKQFASGYGQASKQSAGKSNGPSLSALGIHPDQWLSNPRKAGDEDVGGVESVHVTSGVDVPKLTTDLSALLKKSGSLGLPSAQTQQLSQGLTAAQQAQVRQAIKSAAIDVWAGKDDGTLRRLRAVVDFAVPQGQQSSLAGLSGGKLTLDIQFSDLNQKQTISAPAGARPASELTSAFSGLSGLLGGAGGLGSSSGTTTGSAGAGAGAGSSSSDQTKYLDCLRKAGQDIAKVQGCASLIGG